ncbi:MAG: galactitol-1-phosphate 5-dehydrogenase [Firmicutes bacterium]|nr:galactitol-1-phosphate 5-dehydrogenase [Bacillota bacterium]
MKAAVLHGKRDLRYEEISRPEINEHEVLIRVRATGICGSDLPRVLGDASHYYPNVFGHEFAGEIAERGRNVRGDFKKGDRVTAAPLKPCHQCESCLRGDFALCNNYSFIGSREFGTWAEYVKVPEVNLVKLPEGVSYVQGAFLEPITVALHGLFLMDFKPMTSVAITGMGTIGLLTLQAAKIMGAKEITVFDIDEDKLALAKELGADYLINTGDKNFREKADEITGGNGFEMVLEAAGVPQTELLCLEIAANKGSVMYIGTPHTDFKITPEQFEYLNRKELMVRGSWMSYSAPFPGEEWTLGAYYLGKKKIRIEKLLDRVVPLKEIWTAFEDIDRGKIKGKVMLEV